MKIPIKILIIILLWNTLSSPIYADNDKRALIIAIGKYQEGNGWHNLSSQTDLAMMRETLLKQGFPIKNILTIKDAEATKAGIQRKIETLIEVSKLGDKIVIHFSGHGQQVTDLNGDEADGKDEALVPFDAPSDWENRNYRYEKHIIDDEINQWIKQLRAKIGTEGHLLLILDSCHSGTASRGRAVARGDKPALVLKNYERSTENPQKQYSDYYEVPKTQHKALGFGKFIMFTAAEAQQVNFQTTMDGKEIGSLTYAVVKSFQKIAKGASYENLFANIGDVMQEKKLNQTPTIEGDRNFEIFDGKIVPREDFFTLKKVVEYGKNIVKVMGGQLRDIQKGAKFDILPIGSQNSKSNKPIARGRIVEANAFESIMEIEEGILPERDTEVCGFQTEQSFGDYKVGIKFGIFQNEQIRQGLEDTLKTKKLVYFSEKEADLEISEVDNTLIITLIATANIYAEIPINRAFKTKIINKILDFTRAKIISSLEINNPNFKAEIKLKHARLNNQTAPIISEDSLESYPTFTTSQSGWFIIKNTGKSAFYFTLLDIQPDGQLNVILPDENKGYGFEEVRLEPGQQKGFPIDGFSPPLGIEKFKVIMSAKQENFSFLNSTNRDFTSRSSTIKDESPLESLFKDLTDGTMTRTTSRGVSVAGIPAKGGTCSFTFKIVDSQK
jgi:metacaspase-1